MSEQRDDLVEWWCLVRGAHGEERVERYVAPFDGTTGHNGHVACTLRPLPNCPGEDQT